MHTVKRKQVACNTSLKSDYRLDILTFSAFTAPRYVQPASAAKAISNQPSPCPLPLSRSLVPVESYISFSSSLPWRSPCSESTFARSVCRRRAADPRRQNRILSGENVKSKWIARSSHSRSTDGRGRRTSPPSNSMRADTRCAGRAEAKREG